MSALPFPDAAFDVVAAGYILYFFPEVVPEVARVLRKDGLFLAVTHSEESFTGILEAVGLAHDSCPLLRSLRRFSSENGDELPASFVRAASETLRHQGRIVVEKGDTLFVCRGVRGG